VLADDLVRHRGAGQGDLEEVLAGEVVGLANVPEKLLMKLSWNSSHVRKESLGWLVSHPRAESVSISWMYCIAVVDVPPWQVQAMR
jgi:hypothetical protein